jgi:predicted nucleotidyltransferase component of viral defense system
MRLPDPRPAHAHEDPALFRAALQYTSASTGFVARLIEKDYFCSLLLQQLAFLAPELVFKGGTCLAKIHLGFYRMSEDLDFTIPTAAESSRKERSRRAANAKHAVESCAKSIPGLHVQAPLAGLNNSLQYVGEIGYDSLLGPERETIKLEIALREDLLLPAKALPARTLLLDPLSGSEHTPPIDIRCLAFPEAMAEKLRAALSRRTPAIRDFYDVDHALRHKAFDPLDAKLLELLRAKLAVEGNDPVDVSAARARSLRAQVAAELRPVLRPADFDAFDLDRAFGVVESVAREIAGK